MKNTNYNLDRTEAIIRKILSNFYPSKNVYIHCADDSSKGYGHTFKIRYDAGIQDIWNPVMNALEADGQTWYRSALKHEVTDKKTGKKKLVYSDWIGIRTEPVYGRDK